MILTTETLPIDYVEVRVFVHATEDEDKVQTAIATILPPELVDEISFKKTKLSGYHGNIILLLETRIQRKPLVHAVFLRLTRHLSPSDKEDLTDEIEHHLDKGALYLRLDKQAAYLHHFKIHPSDAIRLKLHFKQKSQKEIIEFCRVAGLLT